DPVLSVVAKRQYQDWLKYRNASVNTPAFRKAIDRFCGEIAKTLRERSILSEERRQLEVEAKGRAEEEEEEEVRHEAEAKRQSAVDAARRSEEAQPTPAPDGLSAVNIGDNYYYGRGVNQDYDAAVAWYKKAANQGLPLGQYNLAWMYAFSPGGKHDY